MHYPKVFSDKCKSQNLIQSNFEELTFHGSWPERFHCKRGKNKISKQTGYFSRLLSDISYIEFAHVWYLSWIFFSRNIPKRLNQKATLYIYQTYQCNSFQLCVNKKKSHFYKNCYEYKSGFVLVISSPQ